LLQYTYFERVFKKSDFTSATLSPFKGGPGERNTYFYEYDVDKKTNFITLSLHAESCGAYCESYTSSYVFDIYTGQSITLIDLLSPIGFKLLEQKIRTINKNRLTAYIKNKPPSTADEYEKAQYFMYEDCYKRRFFGNANSYNNVDQDTSFEIESNNLVIRHGRCSNHASRALDDIGQFVNKFSFAELADYLTADAKLYLSDKPHRLPDIKTPYKIFHGKIANKYPITLLQQRYDNWVYWYDKYKTPISLKNKDPEEKTENKLVLQEGEYNGNQGQWIYTSEFRVQESDGVFNGVFVRLRDGKEMDVTFK
jgi:hypothetical protein